MDHATAHGPDACIRALIEIEVKPERKTGFDRIAARIFKHESVIDHHLISGRYDFLLIVEAPSLDAIAAFVAQHLAPLEHIRSIATHFILKRYKVNGEIIDPPPSADRVPISA